MGDRRGSSISYPPSPIPRDCALYRNAGRIAVVSAALLAAVALLVAVGATAPADIAVDRLADGWGNEAVRRAALFASAAGSGQWLVAAGVVAGLLVARSGRRAEAILPVLVLVAAWLGNALLKSLFLRGRPTTEPWPPGLFGADQYAFPSGHAMDSMATYSLLVFWAWVYWPGKGRVLLAVVAALVPLAIGLSRVVLGVHWISDVVGGWLAGLAVMGLVVLLWARARRHEAG